MAQVFGVSAQWLTFGSECERTDAVLRPFPGFDPDRNFGLVLSGMSALHFFGTAPENLALFTQRPSDMMPTVRPGDTVVVNRTLTDPAAGGVFVIELLGVPVLRRLLARADGTMEIKCDAHRRSPAETVAASFVRIFGRAVSRLSVARIA